MLSALKTKTRHGHHMAKFRIKEFTSNKIQTQEESSNKQQRVQRKTSRQTYHKMNKSERDGQKMDF